MTEAFAGDRFVKEEIDKLIKKFNIKLVVETGTYLGDTTKELSKMAGYVITIENNEKYCFIAVKKLIEYSNVRVLFGNSEEKIKSLHSSVPTLFFLDAHWGRKLPLLDELEAISELDFKKVIVIHDFFVPYTDFGFDEYLIEPNMIKYYFKSFINWLCDMQGFEEAFKRQRLDMEFIKDKLDKIYPDGYNCHYNTKAEGAKVGLIYIYPSPWQ